MADEGTASTLILVGAILQLIFFIAFLGIGAITFLSLSIFMLDPLLWALLGGVFLMMVALYFVMGIFGLIFMILWFKWRTEPSAHKTGLIVTGILGLFLAGFLPALLVLIGAIISPGEAA